MHFNDLEDSCQREVLVIKLNYIVDWLLKLVLEALDKLAQNWPLVVKMLSHYHELLLVFVNDHICDILVVVLEADVPQLHHALVAILGS